MWSVQAEFLVSSRASRWYSNMAAALPDWVPVLTNTFAASGAFSVSVSVTHAGQEFFTLLVQ